LAFLLSGAALRLLANKVKVILLKRKTKKQVKVNN